MYQRFTDNTRTIIQKANIHAKRLCYPKICPEHVLLAITDDAACPAAQLLAQRLGPYCLAHIRARVWELLLATPDTLVIGAQSELSRVDRMIRLANEEADDLQHNIVNTGHLLLGMLREERGIAFQTLKEAGVTLEEMRTAAAARLSNRRTE